MPLPLQFAVTAWSFAHDGLARDFAGQGEIAEALGFHSFWLPENHFGDERSIPSPLMLLAAVAARTSRIGLGSTSYLLPIRHPLQAAEEVAVLDRLSGGRVILGVGRGVQESMFRAFDVRAADKRKRFAHNLDIMMKAWQGDAITSEEGDPVFLAPLPRQRPHPPVWVAAFGPLAIKQAGTLGLPYLASPVETLARLATNYTEHGRHAEAAGHPDIGTVPVMRTVFVSDRPHRVREVKAALESSPGHAMREDGTDIDDWTIVGDRYYVKDRLEEYRARIGMTHLIARGRIPTVSDEEQVCCLESLAAIDLSR